MKDQDTWQERRMKVKAWMSPPTHRVTPGTPIDEAFRMMRHHHVRHLLVMEGDQLVGVVTDRDLRQPNRAARPWTVAELYLVGRDLQVLSVMSTELVTVEEKDNAAYAARLMIDNAVGCLPVLDGGAVVGILTSTDLLKALSYTVDADASWSWESARGARGGL